VINSQSVLVQGTLNNLRNMRPAEISELALALDMSARDLFDAITGVARKSTSGVTLVDTGPKKIQVIKVIREVTGMGLKESKDLVDAAASGKPILVRSAQGLSIDESIEIVRKLEAVGAIAEVGELR